MFKCEMCGKTQEPGTKISKVVTEVRSVTYPPIRDDRDGRIVRVPVGYETAKELTTCPLCAQKEIKPTVVGSKALED